MNGKTERLRGLYAITPDSADTDRLLQLTEEVLIGGARIVQYRNKSDDDSLRIGQARLLQAACARHGALFIINDDIRLAGRIGADGVHLGRDDATLAEARDMLGEHAILGVSCYNLALLACNALQLGADYVAFGAVFPSATKPDAMQAHLSLFEETRGLGIPRVAIGGITPANAARVVDAGADAVAVVSGLYDTPDPRQAARDIAALF